MLLLKWVLPSLLPTCMFCEAGWVGIYKKSNPIKCSFWIDKYWVRACPELHTLSHEDEIKLLSFGHQVLS